VQLPGPIAGAPGGDADRYTPIADAVSAEFAKPTDAMIDAAYEAVRFDKDLGGHLAASLQQSREGDGLGADEKAQQPEALQPSPAEAVYGGAAAKNSGTFEDEQRRIRTRIALVMDSCRWPISGRFLDDRTIVKERFGPKVCLKRAKCHLRRE
jgi:hypothetical protein